MLDYGNLNVWDWTGDSLDYSNLTVGDWARELGWAFGEGFVDGLEITTNEYSFGFTDWVGWTRGGYYVDYYGGWGTASSWSARISRDAWMAAGIVGATGTNVIFEGPKGNRIFQMRWQKSGKPIFRWDKGHYHRIPDISKHRPGEGGW